MFHENNAFECLIDASFIWLESVVYPVYWCFTFLSYILHITVIVKPYRTGK